MTYTTYMSKILLIEDDPLMMNLYENIFKREGFEVDIAQSGAEGLVKAKEVSYDIILLDIMMPEMDGFEVLQKLKADGATKNIPVVTLTNLAGDADAKRAIKLGAIKYLIKSEYDPVEISKMVKDVLSGQSEKE